MILKRIITPLLKRNLLLILMLCCRFQIQAQQLSFSAGPNLVQMIGPNSNYSKFNYKPLSGASFSVRYYNDSLRRFLKHNEIGIEYARLKYHLEDKDYYYDTFSNTHKHSKIVLQLKNYPINIFLNKKKTLLFSAGFYGELIFFANLKINSYNIYRYSSNNIPRLDTNYYNVHYTGFPPRGYFPLRAGIALMLKTKSIKINKYNVSFAYNLNTIPFSDLNWNPRGNVFLNHRLEININKNYDAKKQLYNYQLLQDQRIATRKANNEFRKNHNLELMVGTNHFNYVLMHQFNYISHNYFKIIQGFQVGVRIWNPFKLKNHGIELQYTHNQCALERYFNRLSPTTLFSMSGYIKNSSLYLTYYPLSINIARNLLDVKFGFFGGLNLFQKAAYSMDYQSPFYKRYIAYGQYNNNPYSLFNKFVYGLNVLASVPVYTKEKFAIKLQGQSRFSFNEFKLKEAKLSGICNQFQVACSFKLKSQK